MAHMLDFTKGRAAIGYVDQTPWHGYGFKMNPTAPLEEWQVRSGLDWEAKLATVQYKTESQEGEQLQAFNDRRVVYRSDNLAPLATVSDRYRLVQPATVLEFFRDLIADQGFQMHTAGSLDGGRKIWALAKTGEEARIKGQDQIGNYLLLSTSFDGSTATLAIFTSIRVVCWNTLSYALDGEKRSNSVRVGHSSTFDPKAIKIDLGLAEKDWIHFIEKGNLLAERRVNDKEVRQWLIDVLGEPEKPLDMQPNVNAMKKIYQLFYGGATGSGLTSADGTAWGLVNAATEYFDHHRRARDNGSRIKSAWFGTGSQAKEKAFQKALDLVA